MIWLAQVVSEGTGPREGLGAVIAPYLGVFVVAFAVSCLLTPMMRLLAARHGVVDSPDIRRKGHVRPVAQLGGVSLFLGWLAAVIAGYFTAPHAAAAGSGLAYVRFPISVIVGAGAITLTGLFDDVYSISPRVKIGGQLFAAAALAYQDVGPQLVDHALYALGLGAPEWLVYALGTMAIAVFVVGGCNAMNLLDGLDGLASGTAAIAAGGFLLIAALVAVRSEPSVGQLLSDPVRLVMCLALLGTLLGFLPYNFSPATIFMGDAGSLLVGYLCVATMLLFSGVEPVSLLMVTACLMVFAVPIIDTSLAIVRRALRRQLPWRPDSEHVHHMLRRAGLSVRRTVLALWSGTAACAAVGVGMVAMGLRWRYMLVGFAVVYGGGLAVALMAGRRQRRLGLDLETSPSGEDDAGVSRDAAPVSMEPEMIGKGEGE